MTFGWLRRVATTAIANFPRVARSGGDNGVVRRNSVLLLATLVVVLSVGWATDSGCAGTLSLPRPPIAHFLPPGYRAVRTYRADLSGGAVSDVIVTSRTRSRRGPRGADLQVISWNPAIGRWRLTFDGRSATWHNTLPGPHDSNSGPGYPFGRTYPGKPSPILGTLPQLDVSVDQVAFAPVLGGDRNELVFSGTYGAGGGMQGVLVVVAFRNGAGKIVYSWEGDTGLGPWRITHNVIHVEANFMAPYDAECCPIRTYRFSLGVRAGRIVEVSDDRPFLGIVLRGTPNGYPSVVLTAPNSPAAGRLRPGDVILRVENAPVVSSPRPKQPLKYSIFDTVSSFHAGQTVRLLIQRGTKRVSVKVKLGSLMDVAAAAIRTPTTDGSENAL